MRTDPQCGRPPEELPSIGFCTIPLWLHCFQLHLTCAGGSGLSYGGTHTHSVALIRRAPRCWLQAAPHYLCTALEHSQSVQVNEGYPMAAPTSTVLQATKRAMRYWPLHNQLITAVSAALTSSPDAAASPKSASHDPLSDINSLPGECTTYYSGSNFSDEM